LQATLETKEAVMIRGWELGVFCVGALAVTVGSAEAQPILIDFSPPAGSGGVSPPSPDINGNFWNEFIPGDFYPLVDTANNATTIGIGATTGVASGNNGGLFGPQAGLLGDFAVVEATQDYVFQAGVGTTGFEISGLDVNKTYTIRLFGTRDTGETRETRYRAVGENGAQETTLVTSGLGIGDDGVYNGNDDEIAVIAGIPPKLLTGTIDLEIEVVQGGFAYLGIAEILEDIDVTFSSQPAAAIADAGGTLAFSASVQSGDPSLTVQWERDGVALVDDGRIAGATTTNLTVSDAGIADAGVYRLVATVGGSSAPSDGAVGAVRRTTQGVADFNNDGTIDFFDVLDFLTVFDAAVGP
jgi:hypothetical protein